VGAIIVKDRMIISDGYNGTPSGFENCCEDDAGFTKWYVLHAEANAILKVAGSTQSCEGATLYITLSPCKECSKLIHQSGINRVVYHEGYKDDSGLEFLKKAGVEVELITDLE
jgi:dCMP deaminase